MRWLVFLIFAFITLVLDTSLRQVFIIKALGGIAPCFTAVLVVFVCLFARRASALWAAWGLGVLVDLCPAYGGVYHVIGPYALGYVFGALLVLQLRSLVFRRRLLTMAAMAFGVVLAAGLVGVMIFVVRSWIYGSEPSPISAGAMAALGRQFGNALYTAVLAIPVGFLLMGTIGLWGFPVVQNRRA